jgi:hypothetical protein
MKIADIPEAEREIADMRAHAESLYRQASEKRVDAQSLCMEADRIYRDIVQKTKDIEIATRGRYGRRMVTRHHLPQWGEYR